MDMPLMVYNKTQSAIILVAAIFRTTFIDNTNSVGALNIVDFL